MEVGVPESGDEEESAIARNRRSETAFVSPIVAPSIFPTSGIDRH